MPPSTRASCVAAFAATLALSAHAAAGPIATENTAAGFPGSWLAEKDGTAGGAGVADVYPAAWSIARGEPIRLRVRSTTKYDVRVFRLGWYGGRGARVVKEVAGQPPSPQPYPTVDLVYGIAEARWTDTVVVPTDATWTPGVYAARVEQQGGVQALTFFVMRDDAPAQRMPILMVLPTATHQAYNAWPGDTRGGKSLYDYNSSATPLAEMPSKHANKVSFDRPFMINGGTESFAVHEYPYLRYLEKNGWDVAYCTDQDLNDDPGIVRGRKVVTIAGHSEYWSRPMFENALAARDAGVSFLFLTGDTIAWQVRFEAGSSGRSATEVGYKENWPKDPEQIAGEAAKAAKDIEEAKRHYKVVTRGWKFLENDPAAGIDVRHPGMLLTGVLSAAQIRDADGVEKHDGDYPWADLVVQRPKFFLFDGTGMKRGDRIANVMGYEVDSTLSDNRDWDPFRPPGQRRLASIVQVSDRKVKGSAAWYRHKSGAEVIAMGAIQFSWALDDFAARLHDVTDSVDPRAQTMVANALTRWTAATPPPPPPEDDPADDVGPSDPSADGGVGPRDSGARPGRPVGTSPGGGSSGGGGCSLGSSAPTGASMAAAVGVLEVAVALLLRRRRRRGAALVPVGGSLAVGSWH